VFGPSEDALDERRCTVFDSDSQPAVSPRLTDPYERWDDDLRHDASDQGPFAEKGRTIKRAARSSPQTTASSIRDAEVAVRFGLGAGGAVGERRRPHRVPHE